MGVDDYAHFFTDCEPIASALVESLAAVDIEDKDMPPMSVATMALAFSLDKMEFPQKLINGLVVFINAVYRGRLRAIAQGNPEGVNDMIVLSVKVTLSRLALDCKKGSKR